MFDRPPALETGFDLPRYIVQIRPHEHIRSPFAQQLPAASPVREPFRMRDGDDALMPAAACGAQKLSQIRSDIRENTHSRTRRIVLVEWRWRNAVPDQPIREGIDVFLRSVSPRIQPAADLHKGDEPTR